jgi:hypothetical protein
MSARSFKRAHARRAVRERRRLATLRRKGAIAAGTVLTASALFAATAEAQSLTVTTLNDDPAGGTCTAGQCTTLRDAISQADADGSADVITFASGLTGPITLTNGALSLSGNQDLTITGPGASTITVSGNDTSQVLDVNKNADVSIAGLTITDGNAGASPGGAIENNDDETTLTLSDDVISGSTTAVTSEGGGGIYTIGTLILSGTQVTGNHAPAAAGGGIYDSSKYGLTISSSTIAGNTATSGGGLELHFAGGEDEATKYAPTQITETTISGNTATQGAGIDLSAMDYGGPLTIDASTISNNTGGASSIGGGVLIQGDIESPFDVIDSTISGNTATTGAGVSLGLPSETLIDKASSVDHGSISFENSTIAANQATTAGGGLYLSDYMGGSPATEQSGTADLTSTIVAGNKAAGAANDLDRASGSTTGGFDGAFSLVQAPGSAPLSKKNVITGVDPQLGPLQNNGGPTATMLPAGTSPVIDQGHADASVTIDQRGDPRTVEVPGITDPPGGDGTDIGSLELPASAVVLPNAGLTVRIRTTTLGGAAKALLVGNTTPVTCAVTTGTISSCVIEVRSPKGTVLASGETTSTSVGGSLTTTVNPTAAGLAALAHAPLGLIGTAKVLGVTSTSGSETVSGTVQLIGGPSITLQIGTRSKKLPKALTGQLGQVAKLLAGATSVTCTAYTNPGPHKGKGDKSLTKTQAKEACTDLVKDGFKGKVSSAGKGHSKPVRSSKSDQRLVITFKF